MDKKVCTHPECDTTLRSDNALGYCTLHRSFGAVKIGREGPRRTGRSCADPGCRTSLYRTNTTGFCAVHSRVKPPRKTGPQRPCGHPKCGRLIDGDNSTGWCRAHQRPSDRAPKQFCCGDSCGKKIRSDTKSGYCVPCHQKSPEWAAKMAAYYVANAEVMKASSRASYAKRRDAGLPCRGETTREMRMRGKLKRRAIQAEVFVEHVDLAELYEAHEGTCHICLEPTSPTSWHADHVIPIAMRGPHCWANLAPAHPSCNQSKGGHWAGSRNPVIDQAARSAYRAFHGCELP